MGLGLIRLVCMLPHRMGLSIGTAIGRMAHAFGRTRREIVRRNIALCFPDLDESARKQGALSPIMPTVEISSAPVFRAEVKRPSRG